MSELKVVINERARLVTAVLAASVWPEMEQVQAPHAVHGHGKQLRQFVQSFHAHPAVVQLNTELDKGRPLTDLFTAALRSESSPGGLADWTAVLSDFAAQTKLADFWASHTEPWADARAGLETIFAQSKIMSFLEQLLGQPVSKNVAVMPTITYPMLNPVLAETADTLFLILPPAKAWGESPPWPHGEDPGWAIAQTCWHLAGYFLADTLAQVDKMESAALQHAAVTLCLENDFDEAEAMAYLVRSKKEHNLPRLPLVVEQLRDYLAGNGRSLISVIRKSNGIPKGDPMTHEYILTRTEGRVGIVQFNRPKAMNALNRGLMQETMDALDAFDADDNIGCMVVTGNERAFAAGADIKEMAHATPAEMLDNPFIGYWDRLTKIGKPVIAAVSGYALGGGCELAMACDMIVASETAQFGQPEINLGIIPGAGGTQRMTLAVGKALAMEIMLNGRHLSADEALNYGLINRVVPAEVVVEEAIKLATEIAARAPVALRLAKEAVNAVYEMSLQAGLAHERRLFYMLFSTQDQTEGMDAFINKRKAEWKGK